MTKKEIIAFDPPTEEEIMLIQPNNVTFGQYNVSEWQENLLTLIGDKIQKHMTREEELPRDLFNQPYVVIMCDEADLIRKNPFDFELHNFLIDDSVKRDAVTSKQEKEFLRFVQQDEHFSECYDGMFILFRTGLRIGEFCGLTLKDIDLERRTINVNHQLQYVGNRGKYIEKTKTEAGTRVLLMSDEVYAAFKRVVQNRKKPKVEEMIDGYTGFLFLDKRGKPMMPYQWEKRFQHVVEKYNRIYRVQLPKITPHVCRHTFCTNAAKRGISVETLKYLMGDRKSTRLNSSHSRKSRMPSSA